MNLMISSLTCFPVPPGPRLPSRRAICHILPGQFASSLRPRRARRQTCSPASSPIGHPFYGDRASSWRTDLESAGITSSLAQARTGTRFWLPQMAMQQLVLFIKIFRWTP